MSKINFTTVLTLLESARTRLWNGVDGGLGYSPRGKDQFVCIAVLAANIEVFKRLADAEEAYLRKMIQDYILGAETFEQFYAGKNGFDPEKVTAAQCYEGRLEMIDALIRHVTFMAIMENASARMWDGEDINKTAYEHEKAMYMCHAVVYAVIDVLKLGTKGGFYGCVAQCAAERSGYFRTIQDAIMGKLGCREGQRITADSYYREMYGDHTRQELQAFRIRTMADITAHFATRIL